MIKKSNLQDTLRVSGHKAPNGSVTLFSKNGPCIVIGSASPTISDFVQASEMSQDSQNWDLAYMPPIDIPAGTPEILNPKKEDRYIF